jgi:hypothetical protein
LNKLTRPPPAPFALDAELLVASQMLMRSRGCEVAAGIDRHDALMLDFVALDCLGLPILVAVAGTLGETFAVLVRLLANASIEDTVRAGVKVEVHRWLTRQDGTQQCVAITLCATDFPGG